jgi:hypothetical protein
MTAKQSKVAAPLAAILRLCILNVSVILYARYPLPILTKTIKRFYMRFLLGESAALIDIKVNFVKTRLWVHEINKHRLSEGEFHMFFSKLKNHLVKFFEYYRMSETTFYTILEAIKSDIEKEDTAAAICSDITDAEDILTEINRRMSNYFVLSAITARVKLHALNGAITYESYTFVKIAKMQNHKIITSYKISDTYLVNIVFVFKKLKNRKTNGYIFDRSIA